MRTRGILGCLVAVAATAATLTGCSGSAPQGTGTAPSAAPRPAHLDEARTAALMLVDDYERAGVAVKSGKPKKADPGGVTQYVVSPAVLAALRGDGTTAAPMGCGASSGRSVVDGAIIGAPVAGPAAVQVPVDLYVGTRPAATLTLTTDLAGKVTSFRCGPAAPPALPGSAALVGYYGGYAAATGTPGADAAVARLKQQYLSPGFAGYTRPGLDSDQSTCSEDAMDYWHAVYRPEATRTGAQWYFWPAGAGTVVMSVAADDSPRVGWVYCNGQLTPPLPPAAYSDDQVESYVGDLWNGYAYLLSLKPFGADTAAIGDYFASPDAYRKAAGGTGAQPLECSATAAASINPDSVKVTGTTAVVSLSSAPTTAPLTPGQHALGHPQVTVDLATLKITAVSCA